VPGLAELARKYRTMLAMRLAHDAGDDTEEEARASMAELARRFPGALRELDDLELDVIRRRIAELEAVVCGEGTALPWMEAVSLFHAQARGALQAKRWLAGRKVVDLETIRAFAVFAGSGAGGADAVEWVADLERVAAPPGGRLMDLVFARVAGALGTSASRARHLIFGPPRRERRERTP
jgi:hypothetical protein